jgi:malate synthase
LQYLEAWLRGVGCVPIYNLMEDAATAEICRAQVWQWVRHAAKLDDGRTVSGDLVRKLTKEELAKLRNELGADRYDSGRFREASQIFEKLMTNTEFPEFLTLIAYDYID